MEEEGHKKGERSKRRTLGVHLTSTDTFKSYIFPEIEDKLYDYLWVDLYAGEGNLILPILEYIPEVERIDFFKTHIFLSDVQPEMVEKSINNAVKYSIPQNIAELNIKLRDNLESFPKSLFKKKFPIFHITNPPYLYLGYIRKHKETEIHLKHFENENDGFQDLYQIAMINDSRAKVDDLIYIIPSNLLFGSAVSNKFRMEFLKYYNIAKMYIFETQIFKFTGTNICIGFFKRKSVPKQESIKFEGIKLLKNEKIVNRSYELKPEWKYRAGAQFDEFAKKFKSKKPLNVKYYLLKDEVEKNPGNLNLRVIDTNAYISNNYNRENLQVNEELKNLVLSNILYIRTVDTGSMEGRAGLYLINEDFAVDGIYVSKATYRTSPIHVFLTPTITQEEQLLLKDYFNLMLEYFRKTLDSEFMTTYKYSQAKYTRKYLGLTQVRKIIETFPIRDINDKYKSELRKYITEKHPEMVIALLKLLKELKIQTKIQTKIKKNQPSSITQWL